ncbi:fumarate reductase subunit C [Niveibacterium sp. 24ML]|uniref:fumarate reductase subunit C n=1 Tax=Niveibacterium sp. 24ML TaxID=2985512 RepID=UPI00226E1577|nr:fumarate reductase subunit C [Niveibacterium sp. 24ML]MCX9155298.1 fumarate reductase subunit C [Niveibacterium sp. 24ML]
MNARRPYKRPMPGWWRKNPFFVEYVIHEATACFVAAYAFILLAGLVCLAMGEQSWNAWLAQVRSPMAVLAHLIMLVAIAYHSYTWFRIMPKTLPPIVIGGKRMSPAAITGGGLAAAAVTSLLMLGLAWGALS